MEAILQRIDYNIRFKDEIIINGGVEQMSEIEEYTPEFIAEMKEIIQGKHVGPFENAYELDAYIRSLPDEDEDVDE